MSFICMRMINHFHIKGLELNPVLIQRPGETRKLPILFLSTTRKGGAGHFYLFFLFSNTTLTHRHPSSFYQRLPNAPHSIIPEPQFKNFCFVSATTTTTTTTTTTIRVSIFCKCFEWDGFTFFNLWLASYFLIIKIHCHWLLQKMSQKMKNILGKSNSN